MFVSRFKSTDMFDYLQFLCRPIDVFEDYRKKGLTKMQCRDFCDRIRRADQVYGRGMDEFFHADHSLFDDLNIEMIRKLRAADNNVSDYNTVSLGNGLNPLLSIFSIFRNFDSVFVSFYFSFFDF